MASAAFTIDSTAVPRSDGTAVETTYGATVNLAVSDTSGAKTIEWSIVGTSAPTVATPTVTQAGTPIGSTASFTCGSDPGDGSGVSYGVRCKVTDGGNNVTYAYGVVGVANDAGLVPVVNGEELWRHETYGWTPLLNTALRQSGALNVKTFGATGDGTTDDTAAIVAAEAAALSSGAVVIYPAGTYRIASDAALTADRRFDPGATLAPDDGVIVTLDGVIDAPPDAQIFDGGFVLAASQQVNAAWWGLAGTDDQQALQQALYSAAEGYGGECVIPAGLWRFSQLRANKRPVGVISEDASAGVVRTLTITDQLAVHFPTDWSGGDVTVTGTVGGTPGETENFVASAGNVVVGTRSFSAVSAVANDSAAGDGTAYAVVEQSGTGVTIRGRAGWRGNASSNQPATALLSSYTGAGHVLHAGGNGGNQDLVRGCRFENLVVWGNGTAASGDLVYLQDSADWTLTRVLLAGSSSSSFAALIDTRAAYRGVLEQCAFEGGDRNWIGRDITDGGSTCEVLRCTFGAAADGCAVLDPPNGAVFTACNWSGDADEKPGAVEVSDDFAGEVVNLTFVAPYCTDADAESSVGGDAWFRLQGEGITMLGGVINGVVGASPARDVRGVQAVGTLDGVTIAGTQYSTDGSFFDIAGEDVTRVTLIGVPDAPRAGSGTLWEGGTEPDSYAQPTLVGATAARPSSPRTGQTYFDTDEGALLAYDGAAWANVGGGSFAAVGANTVLCWHLDETAAPYANSGTAGSLDLGNHEDPINPCVHTAGDGCVLRMPAADDGAYSGDTSAGELQSFTLHCWVRWRGTNLQYGGVVVKNADTGDTWDAYPSLGIEFTAANAGTLQMVWREGTTTADVAAIGTLTADVWHHVCVVCDAGAIQCYLDGVAGGSNTVAGSIDYGDSGGWWVGANANNRGYVGDIAEVRLESDAWSAATIRAYIQESKRWLP